MTGKSFSDHEDRRPPITVRPENDPESIWRLDESVAVVVTAPASLYDEHRPEFDARWDRLVASFTEELGTAIRNTMGLNVDALPRQHYRTAPPYTGGMFPEMTDLITIASHTNDVVQDLGGWLQLAQVMGGAGLLWRKVVTEHGEGQPDGTAPPPPLLSQPAIRALCIAEVHRLVGLQEPPSVSIDTKSTTLGNAQHPTSEVYHVVAVRFGEIVRQVFVFLVSAHGGIPMSLLLQPDDPFAVEFLSTLS